MNLAKHRKAKNLTQVALAKKLNISRGLIAQVEAGWRRPYPKLRRKLAKALGVSEEELFEKD
jgi:transcriptional regulator with XRE-family HTH domain